MLMVKKRRKNWATKLYESKAGESKVVKKDNRKMGKWEIAYSKYLDALIQNGEVKWYKNNHVRFLIGEGAWYTPDFIVVLPDNSVELHEVKGFEREAAIVRFKTAGMLYPHFTWRMVTLKKGQWVETRTIRSEK